MTFENAIEEKYSVMQAIIILSYYHYLATQVLFFGEFDSVKYWI